MPNCRYCNTRGQTVEHIRACADVHHRDKNTGPAGNSTRRVPKGRRGPQPPPGVLSGEEARKKYPSGPSKPPKPDAKPPSPPRSKKNTRTVMMTCYHCNNPTPLKYVWQAGRWVATGTCKRCKKYI